MAGNVQGRDCVFQVNVLGSYQTIMCAKSVTVTSTAETVETSTQGTGQFKAFDYDSLSYTINFEDIVRVIDATLNPVHFDMLSAQLQFVEVGFKMFYIDGNNQIKQLSGTVILTSVAITTLIGDVVQGSIEMQGTGELTIDNPATTCDIVISAIRITDSGGDHDFTIGGGTGIINNAGPFTATPIYSGGPAARFDWTLDGGGVNTSLVSTWEISLTPGPHTLVVIPYCADNVIGAQVELELSVISPP